MSSSVRPQYDHETSADAGCACFPVDDEQVRHDVRGEGKDEDHHGAEDSGETRAARPSVQPRMPTIEKRREHERTHCPYRSWCEHCVRGQGCEYGHSTVVGANLGDEVPRVILDYCYFTEKERAPRKAMPVVMSRPMARSPH